MNKEKIFYFLACFLIFSGLLMLVGHHQIHSAEDFFTDHFLGESQHIDESSNLLAHSLPGVVPLFLGIVMLERINKKK